jgi:hypothetical protein
MPSRNGRKYVTRVEDLENTKLACHVFRHMWDPTANDPEKGYDEELDLIVWTHEVVCLRCEKTRTDFTRRPTGEKVRRSRYSEPDRFRVLQKTTADQYRQEYYGRAQARQRSRRPGGH